MKFKIHNYKIHQILKILLVFGLIPVHGIRLQKMHVNKEKITLSGFSSGGTFAQQLQFSFSSLFDGIAVFSHTYYRCSPGNGIQDDYDNVCTKLGKLPDDKLYDPKLALRDIDNFYRSGLIENPNNLRDTKLFVYAGLNSFLFSVDMSMRILEIYEKFIRSPEKIKTVVQNAGLVLPSESYGKPCAETNDPEFQFIAKCGYNGPLDALQFLLGKDSVKKPGKNQRFSLEPLVEFEQTEFFPPERNDMDAIGYIYIPKACKVHPADIPHLHGRGHHHRPFHGCLVHFYFHGCLTGREFVGKKHIENSGYLEIAEANNIVIVFPQAKNSTENTIGCWDTYGFTSRGTTDYATKKGGQVQTVRNILARLTGERELNFNSKPNGAVIPTSPIFPGQNFNGNVNANGNSNSNSNSPFKFKPSTKPNSAISFFPTLPTRAISNQNYHPY